MSEEPTRPFTTLSKECIVKIIAASLQDTPSKKPRVILDAIGKVFPLVGRDKEGDQLLYNLDRRHSDCVSQQKDKENDTIAFLSGFPGIGKTRMNVEYITLLKSAIQRRKDRVCEAEQSVEKETEESIRHPSSECDTYKKLVDNAITTHITFNASYTASRYERGLLQSENRAPESLWFRVLYFTLTLGRVLINLYLGFRVQA
jgi:hypothetical protein